MPRIARGQPLSFINAGDKYQVCVEKHCGCFVCKGKEILLLLLLLLLYLLLLLLLLVLLIFFRWWSKMQVAGLMWSNTVVVCKGKMAAELDTDVQVKFELLVE